ncbi:MAG TPA: hypothetical protein VHN98_12010 [Acidimicrobiales bacterium]|nr:hypothetical protein [Acidimicrobiales bacterium]
MQRRTFDKLLVSAGALFAVVLIVAGFLLMWARNFSYDNVKEQLAQQNISFPAKEKMSAEELKDPKLVKHAGEKVLDGAQAEVYANNYIGLHLKGIANGMTYSEASDASRANPSDTKLAGQVQTLFRGETLRGLLLEAYGFWKFGQIAGWAMWGAFIGAVLMLVLVGLGLWHASRVPEDVAVGEVPHGSAEPATT